MPRSLTWLSVYSTFQTVVCVPKMDRETNKISLYSKYSLADLCLAQNFEQLIVGQEVETAEARSLGLQVVAQPLLHHIQQFRALAKLIQQLGVVAELDASVPGIGVVA